MRLLLDTHVWLLLLTDPSQLRPEVVETLTDTRQALLLSAASSWEISIKFQQGRLSLPEPPETFVPSRLRSTGTGAPDSHRHG